MATETVWDAALQDFKEVEIDRRTTDRQRERRRHQMAIHIGETYATLRETAAIYGIHNSTVYRALAGRIGGGVFDLVPEAWAFNKSVSLERANAARRAKRLVADGNQERKEREVHGRQGAARPASVPGPGRKRGTARP